MDIQKLKEAGISQRAINYLYNTINSEQKKAVLEDEAFQDTIEAIRATDSVPQNAIEITEASQNAIAQIENGRGKTFVLRGNLNFGKTLNIPSDVTIYIDGTITKNGSHKPKFYDDENKGNSVDAVFRVDDKSNVKLIGVNNAKLVSNNRATGVYIEGSSNVEVRGFDIGNVWESVVAHWGNSNVRIFNNYIHDTGKRAIWSLGSEKTQAAHNFIENAGGDGFDFDALTTANVAYENVVIGWRRWAGFVEEGVQDSYYAKNLGIMAEFEYKHPEPNVVPDRNLYPMGWADNGTTEKIPRLTSNNYFM
ncbi:MAG: right-handed parallel beta-helix repeat-containing protein [Xenococcaceae cyanobacterium]